MTIHDEESNKKTVYTETETSTTPQDETCDDIEDPVRRGLCKVCQTPVLGAAPFCKEHEPPVP
jgi:hypothetical protein